MSKTISRALLTVAMALFGISSAYADKALTLSDVSCAGETSNFNANSDNCITGVTTTVTVTNSGDETVDGFSLSLVDYSSPYAVLQTVDYDNVLAAGASAVVELPWNFSLDTWMAASPTSSSVYKRVNVQERVSSTSVLATTTYWHTYYFYKVAFSLVQESSPSTVTSLAYGICGASSTQTVRVRCTGLAPLKVESIDLPDGFTTDAVLPVTLNNEEYLAVNITFDPSKVSGVVGGDAVFKVDGADSQSIALSGTAIGANTFCEQFDSASLPNGWVFNPSSNWSINNGALNRGLQEYAYAITPCLHFDGTEKMAFDASPNSTSTGSSSTIAVEVYYSSDRVNWTQLMGINNTGNGGYEKFPSSTETFNNYVTPTIPEGDWYIGFRMAYSKIDNVVGGSRVALAHDWIVTAINVPAEGIPGQAAEITVTAKNLNTVAEAADSYTVALWADGVQVSTAEAPEWAAGEEKTFTLSYTPTEPGLKVLQAVLSAGAYSVESAEAKLPVYVASAAFVKAGAPNDIKDDAPFKFYNKHNRSRTLITQDELATYGVVPGTVLTGLAYDGVVPSNKDITGRLTVTFGTCEGTELTASTEILDPVVLTDETSHVFGLKTAGSESAHAQVIDFKFTQAYTYNGGNLVVEVFEWGDTYLSNVKGEVNTSLSSRYILQTGDGELSTWTAKAYAPVFKFGVATVPATISGVVTDYTGAAVANATVSLVNPAITYTATTDAEGNYSINVFRNDLTYTLQVRADELPDVDVEGISFSEGSVVRDVVLVSAEPALAFGAAVTTPAEGALYANSENRITGVSTTLTIYNAGGVAFNPGDENYNITLKDKDGTELQVIPVTVALPVGGSIDFTFDWNFSLDKIMSNAAETAKTSWNKIKAYNDKYNTETDINGAPYRDFYYWRSFGDICQTESGTQVTALNYGYVTEASTLALRVRSTGAADLTVSSVELPANFSIDVEVPFTLTQAKKDQVINITFTPGAPGAYAGNAVFHFKEIDDIAVALSAKYVGDGVFYESFDAGVPEDWIYTDEVSVSNNMLYRGNVVPMKAITPKLHFNQNEAFAFQANVINYNARIGCYYSTDRANWTLLAGYKGSSVSDAAAGYENVASTSKLIDYTVNMPEGDYYVAFEMGYCYLDNVLGGTRASVDHDLFITDSNVAAAGKVNNEHPFSLTVKNYGPDEDSYVANLYVDGEVVYSVEADETLASGDSKTFELSHYAHQSGKAEVYAAVEVGAYKVSTPVTTVNFAAEAAAEQLVIGTKNSTNSSCPLSTNWNNSESQTVYTAAFLAEYGLTSGAKITGMAFDATASATAPVSATLTYYLKEVDATTIASGSPYDMSEETPVMANTSFVLDFNSAAGTYELVNGTFDAPYVYAGGNLLVVVRSEASTYKSSSFNVTNELTANCIYKRNDNHNSFLTASYSAVSYVPVVKMSVAKDVYQLSGKVTTDGTTPVADATVTLTSGRVQYSGKTDAEGNYAITVFQPEKEYSVTLSADGYETYNDPDALQLDGANEVRNYNFSNLSSLGSVAASSVGVKVVGRDIVVTTSADANVAVYTPTGVMTKRAAVSAGSTSIPAAAGVYIVVVNQSSFKVVVR